MLFTSWWLCASLQISCQHQVQSENSPSEIWVWGTGSWIGISSVGSAVFNWQHVNSGRFQKHVHQEWYNQFQAVSKLISCSSMWIVERERVSQFLEENRFRQWAINYALSLILLTFSTCQTRGHLSQTMERFWSIKSNVWHRKSLQRPILIKICISIKHLFKVEVQFLHRQKQQVCSTLSLWWNMIAHKLCRQRPRFDNSQTVEGVNAVTPAITWIMHNKIRKRSWQYTREQ